MTHAQFKKAQLDHLADEILEAGGDIDHAAQNIADTYPTTNIHDYTNINQPELDAMKASSTYTVPISSSLKKQILALKGFWQCWGDNLTQEWTTLTIDNFEEYLLMDTGPTCCPLSLELVPQLLQLPLLSMWLPSPWLFQLPCSLEPHPLVQTTLGRAKWAVMRLSH